MASFTTTHTRFSTKVKTVLIGKSRSLSDAGLYHKLSLIAFFAWVGLGADGLSSSCYGPEETFLALKSHTCLSLFVALASAATVFIISASYSQIIELFPSGGGGYLVASKLLSPTVGVVSGCALLIDYVLTITISVASGADALFSLFPAAWLHWKLPVEIFGVCLLTLLNMRGAKEAVLPWVPIFLAFVITHAFVIGYTFFTHLGQFSEIVSSTAADVHAAHHEYGWIGFRDDLYYRLNVFPLRVPPLRERKTDIPLLAAHFLQTASRAAGRMILRFSGGAMSLLAAHSWPGNVRELRDCVERAVLTCDGDTIIPRHLPSSLLQPGAIAATSSLGGAVASLESELILAELRSCGGNKSRAASNLGITISQIRLRVKRYGIDCGILRRPPRKAAA